ncbi:e3 binding domain [Geosmithia morbida]|uniref:E3 binding domain n=1 Tax=Geosmithia morbida TaxID=1094350 RepID=A0A9P5CZ56_9HYPO|nr:e3 binding domain [Geosmithia morbida]KAF4121203.1 e3 binding domain [Geosmithia morbida]
MPALSPTMTEGNIATWNVKEGQTFSAGDVLLEIETDKATMDVEAQEDGIMMKIVQQDGSKGIQVGTRIAVVAEAGDDIASLELPPDSNSAQQPDSAASSSASSNNNNNNNNNAGTAASAPVAEKGANTSDEAQPVRYPLYPSVENIVKANGISEADLAKIKPTGPGGRLLKGDVLAFVGAISPGTPAAISSRFDQLSRLDLSNIKIAAPKEKPAAAAAAPKEDVKKAAAAAPPPPIRVDLPVSLSKVVEVQNKIHDTLGVFLPLSTFIGRAADVANDQLPPAARRQPTSAELFDRVLGLDKVKKASAAAGSRGTYLPQISVVTPATPRVAPARKSADYDVIDLLAGKKPRKPTAVAGSPSIPATVPGLSSGPNVFSLVVPPAEETRAKAFLERCKVILEEEPGRLVL